MRRLRELNLCGSFEFGAMDPNMESRPQFTPKRVKFQFCPSFSDNKTFSKRSHWALEG